MAPPPSSREKILEVAEALFAQRGFAAVGMREVAGAAGLGKSSLFHHFRSKALLYLAVLGRVLDRIAQRLDPVLGENEHAHVARPEVVDQVAGDVVDGAELAGDRRVVGPEPLQAVVEVRQVDEGQRRQVLLLDEPLGALDLKLRQSMQLELKELQHRVGITFVYVTHDQEEALTMSDRIGVMNEGKLLQVDDPAGLYEHPGSRFVANFIGEINLLDGTVADATTVDVGGASIQAASDRKSTRLNSSHSSVSRMPSSA